MGNNLTSAQSLAYQGTNAASPSNVTVHYNAPTANFWQGFEIGDFWVHRLSQTSNNNELWVLMGKAGNVANWVLLSNSSGALLTLTGNSGGPVAPLAGNINVVGDGTTINIVGNPGTHTLTASVVGTLGTVQSLTTDDTHVVTPTAGTINIHGGTGIATTGTVGPNTVTISTSGAVAQSFPTDSGTATPAAGVLDIFGDSHNITTTGSGHQVTVGLTGITQYDVQVGGASNSLYQLANGTTGQILTATTGSYPTWQTAPILSFTGFFAYQTSTYSSVTGDGTTYQIPFDTIVYDTASAYNTSTGVYTIPTTGYWNINAQAYLISPVGGGIQAAIKIKASAGSPLNNWDGSNLPTQNECTNFLGPNNAISYFVQVTYHFTSGTQIYIDIQSAGGAKTDSLLGPAAMSHGTTGYFQANLAG